MGEGESASLSLGLEVPRRRAMRSGLLGFAAAAGATLAVLVVYPSAVLVVQSFLVRGHLSLAHYARLAR